MIDGFFPTKDEVLDRLVRNTPVLLASRFVNDLETPVGAFLKIAGGSPWSFLLESVTDNAFRGRYSIIGVSPDLLWRVEGERAYVNRSPLEHPERFVEEDCAPFASLKRLLSESHIERPADLPPMAAGLFGYLGYDTVRLIERSVPEPGHDEDTAGIPDALLMRPRLVVVFDSVKDEFILVTPIRPCADIPAERLLSRALARLEDASARLGSSLAPRQAGKSGGLEGEVPLTGSGDRATSSKSAADYARMVEVAKDYIQAGDIYQVVLSQRFSRPFALPPFSLYRAIRRLDPSPFLFYLRFGDFDLIGSSPEILVRVRDGEVTLRPIAGTRRRGATPEEDEALARELLADPKERSEHLMLLDLGRNDVGRVAQMGSVRVTEQFQIERYSHVMHIVSNVVGKLREDLTPLDALMAGFPAGTVSGAPKVRAMQIINDLENDRRGPYGGCVGYFASDGAMDSCIVLRTALVRNGVMQIQAGAGIVADSEPHREQKECENKAAAMIRAADEAIRVAEQRQGGQ